MMSISHIAPPAELTSEESAEWTAVAASVPLTRFTSVLLTQYCRHVVRARRIAQLIASIERAENIDVRQYQELIKLEESVSKTIRQLGSNLGLS